MLTILYDNKIIRMGADACKVGDVPFCFSGTALDPLQQITSSHEKEGLSHTSSRFVGNSFVLSVRLKESQKIRLSIRSQMDRRTVNSSAWSIQFERIEKTRSRITRASLTLRAVSCIPVHAVRTCVDRSLSKR